MITIIYAIRDRELDRVKKTLDSLTLQFFEDFEVVLIDYGSSLNAQHEIKELVSNYDFISFFQLEVSQLLWNKSKALNFGIKQAKGDYIFIADIDLIFHPNSTQLLKDLQSPEKFQLFNLGYLDRYESQKLQAQYYFENLKPTRFGKINGMILTSKESLMKINGLDEFYHFYGAEDEDLFARLETAGYKREVNDTCYFYHNWHRSFLASEDKLLTGNPRVKNIMRINQRHFQENREGRVIRPLRQKGMGVIIEPDASRILNKPGIIIKTPNIPAQVEHLLREKLPSIKNEIIRMEFFEDPYYLSFKYRLKKMTRKQTQPYMSLKEVNDMVLKEILFNYRDHNYSYKVGNDLKSLIFCIQL